MATLQDIITNNTILTRSQLRSDKGLVTEIQIKLRNLGLYPGGQWIDGDIGRDGVDTFTWKGLEEFCQAVGLVSVPTTAIAINQNIAQQLLQVKQLDFIFDQAKDTNSILNRLTAIQDNSTVAANIGVTEAFVARTTRNSPFASEFGNYPQHLAQRPDGVNVVSYGNNITLVGSGKTISFTDYPNLGRLPSIDNTGLNFLPSSISHACLCVASFGNGNSPIKTHWLGKDALNPEQLLSATKFIGVLNTVSQINSKFPTVDIDNCVIESPRFKFFDLLVDMVSYRKDANGAVGRSNQIGVLFKRFSKRQDLEAWLKAQTGNNAIQFTGGYGVINPLIANPIVKDLVSASTILNSSLVGTTGNNDVSTYDLVRLISMLGWHLHLTSATRFLGSQWASLECVIRAMATDPARYVDVALETLGLINVISEPVVISKVGFGPSSFTYVALVKLVDRRFIPGKLRTFALALRCPSGSNETRDTQIAAAVTEIIRRIFTEELA